MIMEEYQLIFRIRLLPLVVGHFSQSIAGENFSLDVDTVTSTIDTLNYTFGVAQRISKTSIIQLIVQDNLTDIVSGKANALGHLTEGENS